MDVVILVYVCIGSGTGISTKKIILKLINYFLPLGQIVTNFAYNGQQQYIKSYLRSLMGLAPTFMES